MKHEILHDLEMDVAKLVAVKAFDAYRARYAEYGPKMEWVSDRNATIEFRVKGMRLQGTIGIRSKSIDLDLDVPFVFRLFKGKAIEVIDKEVRVWIAKAKAGELLPSP